MDRQALKPPFAYYGGKTTLAPQIAALLPAHEHYVEPFAGSLAVLLAKKPSRAETVNDLDGDLVTFWRVLRDRPEDLTRACALTPHARSEFELAKNALARTIDLSYFVGRIEDCAARLSQVSIESRDALDVIRDCGSEPDVCLYVDPPYLGTTRATNYRVEMLDDDAHRTFADALSSCRASVVLSGYDSPLYEELFAGWHSLRIAAPTTLSGDTDRVEVLWSNRPLGEPSLFDSLDGGAA